jgi:photosystem II stability/assembly factor-like uncharacterized protein
MLKRFTIFVISCCYLIIFGCSKGDSPTPTPPNPPGGNNTFTISNLVYTPPVIPIKRYIPSFNITGTITFANASEGISKLRLTTSLGFDTTLLVSGGFGQTSGTINGYFELSQPNTPVELSFDIWLIDLKGNVSNKLSGTISIIIDDRGLNWFSQNVIGINGLNEVKFYGNLFRAVGNGGIFAESFDGRAWMPHQLPTARNLKSITAIGNHHVIVGDYGTIFTSGNAYQWEDHSLQQDYNMALNAVASSDALFVAVGENAVPVGRTDILTSPDGINWTRNDFSVNRSELRSVTWTGTQFVAVGIGRTEEYGYALIFTSPDGLHWTDRSQQAYHSPLFDVTWTGNKIIAVGPGILLSSTNGIDWTFSETSKTTSIYSIVYSGNTYVGVGDGIYISKDAINWTQPVPGNHLDYFKTITWSGLNYVAAGQYYNMVMVSPD